MTDEKIIEAAQACAKIASENREFWQINEYHMDHIVKMADKIPGFLAEGRKDKAYRWLGFMQGVLWEAGIKSIEELKQMNYNPKLDTET